MKRAPLLSLLALFALACDSDDDGVKDKDDCAPEDASISPDAEEVCDGIDNNCDGQVDEGVLTLFYADTDGDGFGADNLTYEACEAPTGFLEDNTDCEPFDANSHPGAAEVCDDIDNDCDGAVDGDDDDVDTSTGSTFWADSDGDGYGDPDTSADACGTPEGYVDNELDCDDADADLNPETVWYADFDGDGYGSDQWLHASCEQPEGYVDEAGDCDEGDALVSPGADEICDGIDNNCDSTIDEDSALDAPTWYEDVDGDGFGSATTMVQCYQPSGYVGVDGDCDDTTDAVSPTAWEICDGLDNDCDGDTDYAVSVPTDYGTIQEAIEAATEGDAFCVEAGTYTEILDFAGKSVTVVGAGAGNTILDGAYAGTVVSVVEGEEVELRGMDIVGGEADGAAVAYVDGSSLILREVYLTDHWCSGSSCTGGLFQVDTGTFSLIGAEIDDELIQPDSSTASLGGAVLYAQASDIVVHDTSIHDSTFATAEGTGTNGNYGPTLYVVGGTVDVDGLYVYDNEYFSMYNHEGCLLVALSGAEVTVNDAHFTGNNVVGSGHSSGYTDFNGGWAVLNGADATITNSSMVGNTVSIGDDSLGAFLYMSNAEASLTNVIVAGNTIQGTGAGGSSAYLYGLIYLSSSQLTLVNSDLYDNAFDTFYSAYSAGVYQGSGSTMTVLNSAIVGNSMSTVTSTKYASLLYNSSSSNSWTFAYSNLYENSGGNYTIYDAGSEGSTSGMTGLIQSDPDYTDVTSSDPTEWDMSLQGSSPHVDAGDPELQDTDGTVSDIGAYGGPGSSWN